MNSFFYSKMIFIVVALLTKNSFSVSKPITYAHNNYDHDTCIIPDTANNISLIPISELRNNNSYIITSSTTHTDIASHKDLLVTTTNVNYNNNDTFIDENANNHNDITETIENDVDHSYAANTPIAVDTDKFKNLFTTNININYSNNTLINSHICLMPTAENISDDSYITNILMTNIYASKYSELLTFNTDTNHNINKHIHTNASANNTCNKPNNNDHNLIKNENICNRPSYPYLKISSSFSQPFKRHNSNYAKRSKGAISVTLGAGYSINQKIRVEIATSYKGKYKYDGKNIPTQGNAKHRISSIVTMMNTYWHFLNRHKINNQFHMLFSPYLMAGLGHANITIEDINLKIGNDNFKQFGKPQKNLAWQVGIGSLFHISKNIDLDFTYKYINLGSFTVHMVGMQNNDPDLLGTFIPEKGRLTTHEFLISIHFKFN